MSAGTAKAKLRWSPSIRKGLYGWYYIFIIALTITHKSFTPQRIYLQALSRGNDKQEDAIPESYMSRSPAP